MMFKWVSRIVLDFIALKLAQSYQGPWRATKEKPQSQAAEPRS